MTPKLLHSKALFMLPLVCVLAAACNSAQRVNAPQQPAVNQPAAQKPAASMPNLALHTVGQITRHTKGFIGQRVRMQGYLLKKETGYVIFSDESGGAIGRYDLPVMGPGIDAVLPNHKYELQGTFLDHGLASSNHNPDHLELEIPPKLVQ